MTTHKQSTFDNTLMNYPKRLSIWSITGQNQRDMMLTEELFSEVIHPDFYEVWKQ